jgi:hypothetical protein
MRGGWDRRSNISMARKLNQKEPYHMPRTFDDIQVCFDASPPPALQY